ncbi:MAG: GyrI-like domain-containing protein [Planctomycetota bacterium]
MLKKVLTLISGATCGLIVFIAVAAYFLGAFNSVELAREDLGPYRIVCLPHTGPYPGVAKKILEVRKLLKDAEDQLGVPCGLYYDNPDKVAKEKLRSKGGHILKGDLTVEEPLLIEHVPRRDVLAARLEAHPSLAPIKIYPKMARWMETNNVEAAGPALELYHDGLVECQIPIRPRGE